MEQVRRIVVNGIRGFEGRKRRCAKEGRKLHRTAKESQGARERKKLLSKLNWYRSGGKADYYDDGRNVRVKECKGAQSKKVNQPEFKSVLFVDKLLRVN